MFSRHKISAGVLQQSEKRKTGAQSSYNPIAVFDGRRAWSGSSPPDRGRPGLGKFFPANVPETSYPGGSSTDVGSHMLRFLSEGLVATVAKNTATIPASNAQRHSP